VERLWKKMEQNGLNKERLQLLWASAAEGERFASKVRELESIVENVKPEEIERAKKVFEKTVGGC
jgi:coenzyme F420-reducing hydrogenase delta subunit